MNLMEAKSRIKVSPPSNVNPEIEIIIEPYDDPIGIELSSSLNLKDIRQLIIEKKIVFNEKESDESWIVYNINYSKFKL